uniref:STIM1/2 Orai1-activating region domain-containing protein n=1 Tax=Timema bartmani TaxID=61472 RepID=A0A7R9FA28_9NEOP|nr:unnamed protein product [Timema bartmani]
MHYLHNVLGIKDPIHKQKIALKAMDVVLFGPPKDYNNHIKDLVLVTLLLGALIGCWYAYRQNKNSRKHLRRMMKDMESLQKAELALDHLQVTQHRDSTSLCTPAGDRNCTSLFTPAGDTLHRNCTILYTPAGDITPAHTILFGKGGGGKFRLRSDALLQKELERARLEQENVATEKENLQRQLLEQGSDQNLEMRTSYSDLEVSQLKAEIESLSLEIAGSSPSCQVIFPRLFQMLRGELQKAEGELEDRCWSPPHGLQHWLQITHELENKGYIKKKIAAEKQLQQAREAVIDQQMREAVSNTALSDTNNPIDRTLLNEVTQELQERVVRWKQLELLCGFNIINNNGLQYLENMLNRGGSNPRKGRMSSSQDDLDDDSSSIYTSAGKTSLDDDSQDSHMAVIKAGSNVKHIFYQCPSVEGNRSPGLRDLFG